jgi:hypothetical protein
MKKITCIVLSLVLAAALAVLPGSARASAAESDKAQLEKITGIWYSLPLKRNGRYEIRLTIFEAGTGYLDTPDGGQPHFESFHYDAETGEYLMMMMNDSVTGLPRFPSEPSGQATKKLTEMIGQSLNFLEPVGRIRFIPGKPEKLAVSFSGPTWRDFENYVTLDYELFREEYVSPMGLAAKKAAPSGSHTIEQPDPHWLTGYWKGDGVFFELDSSGLSSFFWPLKDDGTMERYDFFMPDLLWDDAEKAWGLAFIEDFTATSGRLRSIDGYIRPSSGSRDTPSETVDVEFVHEWNGVKTDVWNVKTTLTRYDGPHPKEMRRGAAGSSDEEPREATAVPEGSGSDEKLPRYDDEASFREYFFSDGGDGPALYVPISLVPDGESVAADGDGNIVHTRNFDGGALVLTVERRPLKNLDGAVSNPDGAAELIAGLEGIGADTVKMEKIGMLEEKLGVPSLLVGYAGKSYGGPGDDSTDFLLYGEEYIFRIHIRTDEEDEDKYLDAVLDMPGGLKFIE